MRAEEPSIGAALGWQITALSSKRILVLSWIEDPEVFQVEGVQGDRHRATGAGRIRVLHLESPCSRAILPRRSAAASSFSVGAGTAAVVTLRAGEKTFASTGRGSSLLLGPAPRRSPPVQGQGCSSTARPRPCKTSRMEAAATRWPPGR